MSQCQSQIASANLLASGLQITLRNTLHYYNSKLTNAKHKHTTTLYSQHSMRVHWQMLRKTMGVYR